LTQITEHPDGSVEEIIIEEATDRHGRRSLCDCTMVTLINEDDTKTTE